MDTPAPGLILIAFGVVSMLGAVLNWRFVTRSGKLLNIVLGDTVAHIIYFDRRELDHLVRQNENCSWI